MLEPTGGTAMTPPYANYIDALALTISHPRHVLSHSITTSTMVLHIL